MRPGPTATGRIIRGALLGSLFTAYVLCLFWLGGYEFNERGTMAVLAGMFSAIAFFFGMIAGGFE